MSTATDRQATVELIEHADRLHQVLFALATSELPVAHSRGWLATGAYDHVQEALIQVLQLILGGNRFRAEQVRLLMLDDSGEGVSYWLDQEAQAHQWELDSSHEDALDYIAGLRDWAHDINTGSLGKSVTQGAYAEVRRVYLDELHTRALIDYPLDNLRRTGAQIEAQYVVRKATDNDVLGWLVDTSHVTKAALDLLVELKAIEHRSGHSYRLTSVGLALRTIITATTE